jgi:nitrite reductase (cytochrome c-552)
MKHFKVFALVTALSAFAVGVISILLTDIIQKKQEAKIYQTEIVQITDETDDPAQWGINFPHQYAAYKKTTDQVRTKYGGSEAIPRTPSKADPRSTLAQSRLEEDPRLKIMWAGYAFSHDFREERGHAYMLDDQQFTGRQKFAPQPGACVNCHASTYTAMMKLGDGDLTRGFHALNKLSYSEARKHVTHPVSCIDCHTPKTMALRVTKPAFIEGIRVVKAAAGISEFDVNKMATPAEMRTFVCAQCHVEYYFKGDAKTLTFPWSKGLRADQILEYYNKETKHKDWVHAETGAPVLKAQHPEFEMWNQGIHARSGVSCTDCHMPYERVGASKITDHHIQSPVLNIQRACQTCHRWPEAELRGRVEAIQSRNFEMRGVAMDALVEFIRDLREARGRLSPEKLAEAYALQKRAQFFLDFVEAENSQGFHAPGEALRLLGLSVDASRKGQVVVRGR